MNYVDVLLFLLSLSPSVPLPPPLSVPSCVTLFHPFILLLLVLHTASSVKSEISLRIETGQSLQSTAESA